MTTYADKIRLAPPAALTKLLDAATDAPPRRLLILEDEPTNLECYARLFRLAGYTVSTAATVAEAVRLAAEAPPDLCVSDLMLAGDFGDALLDLLPPGPRFIFVTGSEDHERLDRIRGRGAVVMPKPVDVRELLKRVGEGAEGTVRR